MFINLSLFVCPRCPCFGSPTRSLVFLSSAGLWAWGPLCPFRRSLVCWVACRPCGEQARFSRTTATSPAPAARHHQHTGPWAQAARARILVCCVRYAPLLRSCLLFLLPLARVCVWGRVCVDAPLARRALGCEVTWHGSLGTRRRLVCGGGQLGSNGEQGVPVCVVCRCAYVFPVLCASTRLGLWAPLAFVCRGVRPCSKGPERPTQRVAFVPAVCHLCCLSERALLVCLFRRLPPIRAWHTSTQASASL